MSEGQSGFLMFCLGASGVFGALVSGALYGGIGAELSTFLCIFNLFES